MNISPHVFIQALGQAGFIVRGAGRTIVFDPYCSDSVQSDALGPRTFPPPIEPFSMSDVDYDLFPKNAVNPAYFVGCLYRKYSTQRFKLLQPGEEIIVAVQHAP